MFLVRSESPCTKNIPSPHEPSVGFTMHVFFLVFWSKSMTSPCCSGKSHVRGWKFHVPSGHKEQHAETIRAKLPLSHKSGTFRYRVIHEPCSNCGNLSRTCVVC